MGSRDVKPAGTPVWGWHEPVTRHGLHLGAVVQVGPGTEWRAVCTHADCQRRLTARGSSKEARAALRDHWDNTHRRAA